MTYQFPQGIQQLLDQNMATGVYASEDQALETALRVLNEYHATVTDIQESLADEKAGRMRPLSEVDVEVREELGFSK